MKTFRISVGLAAMLTMSSPALAQSQRSNWVVTPFLGSTSGGSAPQTAATIGISGGWTKGRFGIEGDLGWTPEFFEQDGFRTTRRVLTVMGNGVVNVPAGSRHWRPYFSGGLGSLQPKVSEAGGLFSVDERTLGWDAGGGADILQGRIGLRADLRYFRRLKSADDQNAFNLDFSKLGFWRVTAGMAVRF